MAQTYSYWSEYQKEKKKNEAIEQENHALKMQVEALKNELLICKECSTEPDSLCQKQLTEALAKIRELQDKIYKLEEELSKDTQSDENRKVAVHTRVIEAINRAFED